MAPEEDLKSLVDNIAGAFTQTPPPPEEKPPKEEGEVEAGAPKSPEAGAALTLDLSKPPEEIVGDLLKHPAIGRQLQSWMGKAAAKQVRNALEQANLDASQQAERQALKDWEAHFQSLSQEELAEELRADKNAAIAYSKVQEWKSRGQDDARMAVVQVYAGQVQSILTKLENSGLPDDIKETLKPENWQHLGAPGIFEWSQAVDEAVIEHKAAQLAETKAEARKQQELAERDKATKAPDMTAGRRAAGGKLDLMSTPSPILLETALAARQPDKQQ